MDTFAVHCERRGLTSKLKCWRDDETEILTFPLWHSDKLVGYQRYDWRAEKLRSNQGRYFTWITEEYRPLAVWGTEYLRQEPTLFICEGIWDAVRILNSGRQAIATLTATPNRQFVAWFKREFGTFRKIGILDRDENKAGMGLVKLCDLWYNSPVGFKDMGEMSQEQASNFIERL